MKQPSVQTTYTVGNRSGTSVLEFEIERAGTYQISADYPDNPEGQKVVLAVGQGVAGRIAGTVLGGLGLMFGSVLLAGIIALLVFLKRRKSKRAMAWTGYPAYPPAYARR